MNPVNPKLTPLTPDRCTLVVLTGLPYSGKSTHAKTLGHPTVSPNAIRQELTGQRFYGPAEPIVWATAGLMVRALFAAGHDAVTLDSTMYRAEHRGVWLKPALWLVEYHLLTTPADVCLDRATAAGDGEIIPVIRRMAAEFAPFETHGPEDDLIKGIRGYVRVPGV